MKKLGRVFRVHVRQVFSLKLLIFILLFALLTASCVIGYMGEGSSVWYLMISSGVNGANFFTLYLLPAFCCAPMLAQEWQWRAAPYWAVRVGIRRYTLSKIMASALSGFLVVALGFLLFAGAAGFFMPVFNNPCMDSSYQRLMMNGFPLRGLMAYILDLSMSGAIVAALGTAVSSFFMSPVVAAVSPLAMILVLSRIADSRGLPYFLNAAYWLDSNYSAATVGQALLGKALLTVFIMSILCWLTVWRMERRMRNEA